MYRKYRLKQLFIKRIGGAWGLEPDKNDKGLACLRAADILTDEMAHKSEDLTFRVFSDQEIKTRQLKQGDIIIEKSGGGENQPVGRVALFSLNEKALCSNFLDLLRPNNKIVQSEFLVYCLYYLWKSRIVNLSIKQTTGIQNLDIEDYFNNEILIPSLTQQNKIVAYLDQEVAKIDTLIKKKTRLVELLEEKKKATISQAVTKGLNPNVKLKSSGIDWLGDIPEHWEVIKLKYIVNKIDEYTDDEVQLKIAVENIESYSGRLINIDNLDYESKINKFKKGDVIFNKLRPYLAKVYFAEKEGGVFGELLVLRGNSSIFPKFLFYLLISTKFIDLVNSSSTGTKMPRASWEDFIKNVNVPLISYSEQELIANELDVEVKRIHELNIKINNSIDLLKEKRTAIISAAINWEINL